MAASSSSARGSPSDAIPGYWFATTDHLLQVFTQSTTSAKKSKLWQCRDRGDSDNSFYTSLTLDSHDVASTRGKLYTEADWNAQKRDRSVSTVEGPAQVYSPLGKIWTSPKLYLSDNETYVTITTSFSRAYKPRSTTAYCLEPQESSRTLPFRVKDGQFCVIRSGVHLRPERDDAPLYEMSAIPGPVTLILPAHTKLSAGLELPK